MPGVSFGVEGIFDPADVEVRLPDGTPVQILDIRDIIAVDLHATLDAPVGTPIEYRVLPVDGDQQETTWTAWTDTVVAVPEPGPSWAYLACALLVWAMLRRRMRR